MNNILIYFLIDLYYAILIADVRAELNEHEKLEGIRWNSKKQNRLWRIEWGCKLR